MQSLKRYFDKLKLDDKRPLALFHFCDQEVTRHMVHMNQLLKSNPDDLNRRNEMIQQLKQSQHNLMNAILTIIQDAIPESRSHRYFRAKYPDDVLLDQINGPIWFGAECIAAGSHIANHEWESNELRPYAVHLTECVQKVRDALREQCQKDPGNYPETLKDLLRWFDFTWAEFEFRYVSLMCSVKTEAQYSYQQSLIVLFSEATSRAIKKGYLTKDMVECMDPSLMFSIPRLAIVCGVGIHEDGPLCVDKPTKDMPLMFRVYKTVLSRVKELLGYLSDEQFERLERALCSAEGLGTLQRKNKEAKWKTFTKNSSEDSEEEEDEGIENVSAVPDEELMQSLPETSDPEQVFEPRPPQYTERKEGSSAQLKHQDPVTDATTTGTTGAEECKQSSTSKASSPAAGRKAKSKGLAGFSSPEDLMHRLFVAISGVADQLQTNYARDLRVILKHVFLISQSEPDECDLVPQPTSPCTPQPTSPLDLQSQRFAFTSSMQNSFVSSSSIGSPPQLEQRPEWVPDSTSKCCQSCNAAFTFTRRRHHCRNCGQMVCRQCSPNSIPLLKFQYKHPVRVCTKCYIDHLSQLASTDGYRPMIL